MSPMPLPPLPLDLAKLLPPAPMPLGPGQPRLAERKWLAALSSEQLCGGKIVRPDLAAACRAALWLQYDFLDEAHQIVQEIDNPVGSYWHAIVHRREGDYSNAKYWLRRAGELPFFPALGEYLRRASPERSTAVAQLIDHGTWDAERFVDLCRNATAGAAAQGVSDTVAALEDLQQAEWQLLFVECHRGATAG